jgi:hypothetical protein
MVILGDFLYKQNARDAFAPRDFFNPLLVL